MQWKFGTKALTAEESGNNAKQEAKHEARAACHGILHSRFRHCLVEGVRGWDGVFEDLRLKTFGWCGRGPDGQSGDAAAAQQQHRIHVGIELQSVRLEA